MILACFMYDCGLGYLGMFYVCMLGTVLWCPTACRCVLAVALDMPAIDIGTCAKSFFSFCPLLVLVAHYGGVDGMRRPSRRSGLALIGPLLSGLKPTVWIAAWSCTVGFGFERQSLLWPLIVTVGVIFCAH